MSHNPQSILRELTRNPLHVGLAVTCCVLSVAIVAVIAARELSRPAPRKKTHPFDKPVAVAAAVAEPPAEPKQPTDTEIDQAWLAEVFDQFGGLILHHDSPPKTVTLGDTTWTRTNGIATVSTPRGIRHARAYRGPDTDRRLALLDEDESNEFALVFMVQEQRQNVGGSWVAHGHTFVIQGYPGKRLCFCSYSEYGKTARNLTIHVIDEDGDLVPTKTPVVSVQN